MEGLVCAQMQSVLFLVLTILVIRRFIGIARGGVEGAVVSRTVAASHPETYMPSHADLPEPLSALLRDLRAAAGSIANGGEDQALAELVDEKQAAAIANGARVAGEAIRERAKRANGIAVAGGYAAPDVRIELMILGTHMAPMNDPKYAEIRIGYARKETGRQLAERRIFGDQIWRAWLVGGTQSGQCPLCGAPLRREGAHVCEYCGARTGSVVWRVLRVEVAPSSDANLAPRLPYLNGRSIREAFDATPVGNAEYYRRQRVRPSLPAQPTFSDGDTQAVVEKLARDLESSLDQVREG